MRYLRPLCLSLLTCLWVGCGPSVGEYVCPDGYTLDGATCLPMDIDSDGDGIIDGQDNCPNQANPEQLDLDGDRAGNACDLDDDADSIPDLLDNCPLAPNPGQEDLDGDALGDACDDDDDQDGIPDEDDLCPRVWDAVQANSDGDELGNACDDDDDGDGIPDEFDNCPVFPNSAQVDDDFDGVGDLCQNDADGDGIPNEADNCVLHSNVAQQDTDLDGEGNACDADDDDDGILDPFDNCPNAANPNQQDADKNSIGDACEGDLDGDGIADQEDNCPLNSNADQADFDADSIGNLCDEDANGDGHSDLISRVSPASGLITGGDEVQLHGSGFKMGAAVAFGGIPAEQVLVLGPELILAQSPEGSAGATNITVTNPDGQLFTGYSAFHYLESTQVHGRVLDSNLVPVANVLVDLTPSEGLPVQAATDATGHFVLEDAPAGTRTLAFNPANAGVPGGPSYPALKVPIEVTAGQINVVGEGRPTFLPILDTSHVVQIDPSTPATVQSSAPSIDPNLQGAVLEVAAGNAVDENGNPYSGELLISEVPQNRTPQALSNAFAPGYLVTVQPAGVEFVEPAPVSLPNFAGLEPGEEWPLWGMNHDTGEFEVMGTLQVNASGDRIETIDGGITTSAWWPGAPGPMPPLDPDTPPADPNDEDQDNEDDCEGSAGSSVNFGSGNLTIEHRLVPYVTGDVHRTLRFVYTLHGANPVAQLNSRFFAGGGESRAVAGSRVLVSIDGEQVYDELISGGWSDRLFPGEIGVIETYIPVADYPTGNYPATTSVYGRRGRFDVSIRLAEEPQQISVWNARQSPLGVGWGIAELTRIYRRGSEGSVLLATGTGSMQSYQVPAGGVGTAAAPSGDSASLDFLADGSYEHHSASGVVDRYGPEGLLLERVDSLGASTNFSYDNSFRLVEVTDAHGLTTQLSYQGAWLATVTDHQGRVTQFDHDAQGHLVAITDPDGTTRSFSYDAAGRMTAQQTPLGHSTRYTFNEALNSIASIELPDGTLRSLSPNRIDAAEQGLQVETLADNSSGIAVPGERMQRNDGAFIDGDGNRFEFETDRAGRPIRRTGPDGATFTSEYDDLGNLASSSGPDGLVVSYQYDTEGEYVTEITGLDSITGQLRSIALEYDPSSGQPSQVTYPDGTTTSVEWDADGLPISATNAAGGVTTFAFDGSGNMTSLTSPMGATTQWLRDSFGRVTERIDPDGHSVSRSYDSLGRLSEIIDAAGSTRSFAWNENNTLASVTDGLGDVTEFGYDADRRRTSITDPSGRQIQYEYDQRDRLIARTDPIGTERYEWSSNNQMTAYVRRNGERNQVELDAYDRPIRKVLADGEETSYAYDLAGRLIETSNQHVTLTFEYDAPGHLLRETMTGAPGSGIPTSDIQYSYDIKGRRTGMSTADGERSVAYVWNALNQVTEISEGGTTVSFEYDEEGRVIGTDYGADISGTLQWSPGGRLEDAEYSVGSEVALGWTYTYDGAGLRASRTDEAGNLRTYDYDDLGSITSVDRPGTSDDESYSYDSMGNRSADHATTAYSYDAGHRLLEDDSYLYSWADTGELLSRTDKLTGEAVSYSWDSESRLIAVNRTSALGVLLSTASYRYDPLGRRIARTVDGQAFFSVYAGKNVLQEYTSDGLATQQYVYGGLDQPLWKRDLQGNVSFFVLEGNGNVAAILDEEGNLLERYSYDAFGNRTELLGAALNQPLGLHARPLDPETGLYNFRRRYYSPVVGRFICEDAFGGRISNALGMNPYVFAFNDPFRFIDPFGDFSLPFGGSAKAGAGAGGTLCFGVCLGLDISLQIDSNGNIRFDLCGTAGFGIGAKGRISGQVGAGEVSTEASASVSAKAEASASLGPCKVGGKAEISQKRKLGSTCGPTSDSKLDLSAKCGPFEGGISASKDGLKGRLKGPGIPNSVKKSKSKGEITNSKVDLGAGAAASVEGKACIGGGATL